MTTQSVWWLLIFALAVLNALTWAVYRWDKRQARRGARRIPERTLLLLAWIGGWLGALLAVYGHRQRHKAQKPRFMMPLWLAVIAWVGGIAYWLSMGDELLLR